MEEISLTNEQKQDYFNKAYTGLKNQGFKRCMGRIGKCSDEVCLYRSGDLKCAVGHIIPDTFYTEDFEGKDASSVMSMLLEGSPDFEGAKFLTGLQSCHDRSYDERSMEANLQFFANRYGLEVPK